MRTPNYDKFPHVQVTGHDSACWRGWPAVLEQLRQGGGARRVIAVECNTCLHEQELLAHLRTLATVYVTTEEVFLPEADVLKLTEPYSGGNDPIFGFMTRLTMGDFLDSARIAKLRETIANAQGTVIVYGPGATLACEPDVIVYADMPRWEGQLRQRRAEVVNLGLSNRGQKASLQYKRSFFIDWRVCDKLKRAIWSRIDFFLDSTQPGDPRLVAGPAMRDALAQTVRRPFRLVPFFDPGPWGGQWMKEVCDLDRSSPNYAWCFDCVPEENSLLLRFGETIVEVPSINLVFAHPRELLGEGTYGRYGAEFPIRFDFLDTIDGGNLSFQVHPLPDYAREHFGLHYTQDESYYILDAQPGGTVYLGVREDADPDAMIAALQRAQDDPQAPFPADDFAVTWEAKAHDHFLIPAGTVHCSGKGTMVLEISHTPYIFTLKLWDWGRLGLDGLPRPINLERGRQNIVWDRREAWVGEHLVNAVSPVAQGEGWREERTGLYQSEAIETRRHWFTGPVPHHTGGEVNVLNLVQGESAIVESPDGAFEPFEVHYAETFVIPAAAGAYTIRPGVEGTEMATLKAYIRTRG